MDGWPYKTTVSVAAASRDLTTLEAVERELGDLTTEQETYVETDLIPQASQIIATYCNRDFAQETLVDYFRLDPCGRAVDRLMLSRRPIASIASVVEDGTTLDTDEYEYEASTGFLWRLDGDDNRTDWGTKIVVTHVSGYEMLDTLPADIQRACVMLVTQGFRAQGRDPLVKAERVDIPGVEEKEVSYWVGAVPGTNGAISPEIEALISPYRVLQV